MRRVCYVLTAVLVTMSGPTELASAATVRAQWDMSPSHGVVVDRAGRANLRLFGAWTNVRGAVGRAVRFRWNGRPAGGTVRTGSAFNPGTAPFAVGVTLRTQSVPAGGRYSPNVVQKGLFDDRGQWKMEVIRSGGHAVARCRFSGTRGHRSVLDRSGTALDNGRWHTVICWRAASAYGIRVDGRQTRVGGTVGSIVSSRALRVASKTAGAGVTDQFQGAIDCVTYVQGALPLRLAAAKAHC
ncbi:MAG: hypothetical protein QOK30_1675 [Nocardioidaceae bacterium]|jgi:hypothetical protein|nr:hypothetical protein [Nocardioidaceae bacterium]